MSSKHSILIAILCLSTASLVLSFPVKTLPNHPPKKQDHFSSFIIDTQPDISEFPEIPIDTQPDIIITEDTPNDILITEETLNNVRQSRGESLEDDNISELTDNDTGLTPRPYDISHFRDVFYNIQPNNLNVPEFTDYQLDPDRDDRENMFVSTLEDADQKMVYFEKKLDIIDSQILQIDEFFDTLEETRESIFSDIERTLTDLQNLISEDTARLNALRELPLQDAASLISSTETRKKGLEIDLKFYETEQKSKNSIYEYKRDILTQTKQILEVDKNNAFAGLQVSLFQKYDGLTEDDLEAPLPIPQTEEQSSPDVD